MADKMIRRNDRNPTRALNPLRRRTDFFAPFSELFDDFNRSTGLLDSGWAHAIDVIDKPDQVVVKADIPGLEKDDIDIAIHGDTLTISGEKKEEWSSEDKLRSERFYGSFQRALTLPAEVNPAQAKATLKNGVLELVLPKVEHAKEKKINIDVK